MSHQESDVLARYFPMFDVVKEELEKAFRVIEKRVPSPKLVPYHGGMSPRYSEKTAQQALLQKLARYISGLHALRVLLSHGLLQEQAVIQRTLDEIAEDILFLTIKPKSSDDATLLNRYLEAFYFEEFEENVSPLVSMKRRDQIPRKKIRGYIGRHLPLFAGAGERVGSVMSQAYSGYVHAASPQLMELCAGAANEFRLSGMSGTSLIAAHTDDAWNYFIRGISNVALTAAAFQDRSTFERLSDLLKRAEAFVRIR